MQSPEVKSSKFHMSFCFREKHKSARIGRTEAQA